MMTSWRKELVKALSANGEGWDDVDAMTFQNDAELDQEFNPSYGTSEGISFCLWTHCRVYFPVVYDGAEWVESVSRHPDGKPVDHLGGQ